MKEILKQTTLSYCQTKADEYIEKALALIPKMVIDKKWQALFNEMGQFLTWRTT